MLTNLFILCICIALGSCRHIRQKSQPMGKWKQKNTVLDLYWQIALGSLKNVLQEQRIVGTSRKHAIKAQKKNSMMRFEDSHYRKHADVLCLYYNCELLSDIPNYRLYIDVPAMLAINLHLNHQL